MPTKTAPKKKAPAPEEKTAFSGPLLSVELRSTLEDISKELIEMQTRAESRIYDENQAHAQGVELGDQEDSQNLQLLLAPIRDARVALRP